MSLLQQLVEQKILDKDQARSFEFEVKESGKKEEEIILEKGITSEFFLFSLKSKNLGISLKEVAPEKVPLEVLKLIPEKTAKYYKMISLAREEQILEVGMVYPEDLKAQEAIKFLARQGNFSYKVFLITPSTFAKLLKQYRTLKKEVSKALKELETELKGKALKFEPRTTAELQRLTEEAPITKIVAVLLKHAVEGRASDLHIEPTKEKLRVRFRSLGALHSSIFLPLKAHSAILARIKILANLKIDETRIPQDGRFSAKIEKRFIDFRVSTFPTTLGEKVAIRVLDPFTGLKTFEKLGVDKTNLKLIEEAIKKPYGLILATGPTGCGKTTTLYAILQILNKERINIVTLEDPVEYFIEGINQSQIKPEIGYDFAMGLRHIIRQDPDIIMVGEIRDNQTASLAIHAALTGHLVLSTLHTSNALGVIPRLIDMGIQPYLIPPTLSVVIAQRLVRRLCDNCKEKIKPKKEIKDLILKEIAKFPDLIKKELKIPEPFYIYQPKGCKKCNNQGFTERIALFEVLLITEDISDIILKKVSEKEIAQQASKQGMITMKQDGILKVLGGITTIEEVIRVAEEK